MKSFARVGFVALALVGLTVVACSSTEPAPTPTPEVRSVQVELKEWSVIPSSFQASSGTVAFQANNTGTTPHELVVVKTNLAPTSLPIDSSGSMVDESELDGLIGEFDAFPPGENRSVDLTLDSGNYVLICNLPGHYERGMSVAFTVN